ncbi:proline dehydrogenase family protein [Verrucomicrobium spinosum]|uniref:proline dehydrogenase family protein n=1 Tax=Verrucomicrobium spinosum TaxID=2736 RepID=UPI002108E9D8|nr:proline dehydrogenase family protein [Verrucomicrobium spinosum]
MANPQRRALLEKISNLLLYAPACGKEQFVSAIGYLIRRLDENTGGENFLRHAFHLEPGSLRGSCSPAGSWSHSPSCRCFRTRRAASRTGPCRLSRGRCASL